MPMLAVTPVTRGLVFVRHIRSVVVSLFALLAMGAAAQAGEGPFVGVDLGVSKPVNGNYRAHVQTGATLNPYAGYMLNNYLGLQGQLHFVWQPPDNDHRGNFAHENRETTVFGLTFGPRIALPIDEYIEVYGTGQAGFFTGLSGRIDQTGGGVSAGGGMDVHLTSNLDLSFFGRWNRAFMAPRPTFLTHTIDSEQGPADAQWASGGLGVMYHFGGPAAPPPPAPAPPAAVAAAPEAPPPAKKKLVLRSVHFDYDKANIRTDAVPVLNEAVEILKEEGTVAIVVEGHTDGIGSDAYNLKLSRRRADAVRGYLTEHGIAASRIRTEGFGKSKPVASNENADGRAQNRRVELRVE
jgi:outer membrane protein OmpA-like peptidoglycan-associated protein